MGVVLDGAAPATRGAMLLEFLAGRWRTVPVLIALALIWAVFATQSDVFLSSRNLSTLALQIVVTSVIGLSLVLVLIAGEIDLSVAYLSAVCAAVAATLSVNAGWPFALALSGGVGTGALWGFVQGFVTTRFAIPSFIVTLGGSLILTGALQKILPSDTYEIGLVKDPIASIANTFLPGWASYVGVAIAAALVAALRLETYFSRRGHGFSPSLAVSVVVPVGVAAIGGAAVVSVFEGYRGVPVAVALLAVLLCSLAYLTTQTRFGVHLYAIGGNAEAARRAGIPVDRVRIVAFALAGALAGTGGIIAASRVFGVSPLSADPVILLEAIAAVVIGGVSLFGGRGSVWGALTGALVMGSITNGLLLLDVSTPVRLAVQGTILILAVVTDALIVRRT